MTDGPTFEDRWSALQETPKTERLYVGRTPTPDDSGNPTPQRLDTGKEIATLEVRGSLFTNWTSVRVEQRVTQPFPVFQFECTEESPVPMVWDALQFVPGTGTQPVMLVSRYGLNAIHGPPPCGVSMKYAVSMA